MTRLLAIVDSAEREHFFGGDPEGVLGEADVTLRVEPPMDGEALRELLADFEPNVVVGAWRMPPLPREGLRENGGSLDYFCYLSGSVSGKISKAHLEDGLVVTNWGSAIGPYVAECTLMLILCTLRQLSVHSYGLRERGEWRPRLLTNRALFGKRVGLHGFGSIAQHLVDLLRPFDCRVTADTGVPDALLETYGVRRVASADALFAESDVLVELKALTPRTQGCVDERLLRMLPDGAAFINVSRGAVVKEEDLIRVASERDLWVGLDVYEDEPLPLDSPLRKMDNVFLLPHMGGATRERGLHCGRLALSNVKRHLAGEPLENVVTPEVFERAT